MNQNIKSVAYGNGVFIAAAGDRILKSTDGENWTLARMTNTAVTSGNQLTRAIFGDGKFLVCGEFYFYITSDNGITWTEFSSPSGMAYAAYGDGKFYLSCTGGSGIAQVDLSTMQFSWLNYTTMGEIAYLNHTLYTVKQDSTDANLYRLNSSNVWEGVVSGIPTGSNRTLRSVGNRLFMGMGTYNFEFQKGVEDADFTSFKWVSMIYGKMLDGCEANGRVYIMTVSALYEEEKEVASGTDYVCCCAGGDGNIHLYTPSAHSVYTPESNTSDIRDIAYGNGVYIAAAGDKILKSTDRENWTVCKTVSGAGHELNKVLYGDGTFLVYGQSYYYLSSDNGAAWTEKACASYLRSAAYGGGYFWMCTTLDGLLKIHRTSLENTWLNQESMGDIAYWDGKLFGVKWNGSDQGVYVLVESDNAWFETIVNLPQGDSSRTLRSAGGRLFVGNGATTLEVVKSPTGAYSLQDTNIAGKMVDACEFGVKAYILTASTLYENSTAVANTANGSYLCCCTGGDGKIYMLSDTGEFFAFTPSTDGTNYDIQSVAYGNGVYMAASGDCIIRSTDCENWTVVKQRDTSANDNHMKKVVYGNGAFLVCGESSRYITSDNGVTWTEGRTASYMDCAAFGEGKFLLSSAVHPGTLLVDAETFALTWVDYNESMSDLAYWNNQFVGVKNSTTDKNIYTLDLATNKWIAHASDFPSLAKAEKRLRTAGDKLYLGFSDVTKEVDENWGLSDVQSGYLVDAVQLDGNIFLLTEKKFYQGNRLEDESPYDLYCCMAAGGEDGNVHLFTLSGRHTAYQPVQYVDEYDIKEIAYGNGIYMAAAGDKILKSTDGLTWTLSTAALEVPILGVCNPTNICYGDGNFVAYSSTGFYFTSDNGANWTVYGSPFVLRHAAYGDGKYIFVANNGTLSFDPATEERTWLNGSNTMDFGQIVFLDGSFYAVKTLESDRGLYRLNGSSWDKVNDLLPATRTLPICMRGANGRLLLGVNGSTYEFTKNAAGEFTSLAPLPDVRGQMADACGMDGETYILSGDRFYQGTLSTHEFEEGRYRCITPGKFAKMNVSAPASCILLSDGGSCAVYEPVEPVDEYRIRSVSFHDGVYIAATSDRVLKSFDGHHWFSVKKLVRPDRTELKKVVLGDGKFLVCGRYDYFISSDNGLSWKEDSSFHAMEYAAYGNGKFITTSSQGWAQQIDAVTLERSVLESLELVDDVACWNGRFVAVKNDVSDRNIYVLTSNNIWEKHELINCPALTKAEKTLRVVNGVAYLGVNNSTKEIGFNREGYQLYDIAIDEFLVDSCEVDFNSYLLTSSTLFENDYPVQTVPDGRVFVCCTAGKVVASALTRAAGSNTNGTIPYSDPTSGDGNSDAGGYTAGSTPPPTYTKGGSVRYSVIADTHNSAWGERYADFDLGDNTMAHTKCHLDAVDYPKVMVRAYGNHDTEKLGGYPEPGTNRLLDQYGSRIKGKYNAETYDNYFWADREHQVLIYALNSSLCQSYYHIPIDEIRDLANRLQRLKSNWDVIVLTHVPLFDGDSNCRWDQNTQSYVLEDSLGQSVCGYSWPKYENSHWVNRYYTPDEIRGNRNILIMLLQAFHNHESKLIAGIGSCDFSRNNGHVIGCFAGHVHNHFVNTMNGLYMETFTTNGCETALSTEYANAGQSKSRHGTYIPEKCYIDVVFGNTLTVNGHKFVDLDQSQNQDFYCKNEENVHKKPDMTKGARGVLRFSASSGSYPKFHPNGTYLGFSSSTGIGTGTYGKFDPLDGPWYLGEEVKIYVDDTYRYKTTKIFFDARGLLRYYYTGADNGQHGLEEIDGYMDSKIHFVANNILWEFQDGKYQHHRAGNYQLDGQYYPAFDKDGRYIGWSDVAGGYLIDERKSSEGTRRWAINTNGLSIPVLATESYGGATEPQSVSAVIFGTDGKLESLVNSRSGVAHACSPNGSVKFTLDNNSEWIFENRILTNVVQRSATSKYRSTKDNLMSFTAVDYYFTFSNGYLYSYRRTNDSEGTQRTDDIDTFWACNRDVYYYGSAYDAYQNRYFKVVHQEYLRFKKKSEDDGHYIDNLYYAFDRGLYAKINGYYFYCDGTNGWRLVTMIP